MAERFVQWSGVHFSDGGGFIFKGWGCSMGGIGLNGRVFEKNYNLRGGGGGGGGGGHGGYVPLWKTLS